MAADFPGIFLNLVGYLTRGISQVEGWLSPTTASIIADVLIQQARENIAGDVCEIGVHHGRLFLVLANATVPGETAVAVDVFDEQAKNLDQSGHGDRGVFERHIALYSPGVPCEIIQASSLDLHIPSFLNRRFRFISVDGGHTAAVTANDLRLAEATLAEGGIVALDDILSSVWTGVLSGLIRYRQAGGTLTPFAIVPNKLLLANSPAMAMHWRNHLARKFPLALAKTDQEFLDLLVDSFNDHDYYDHESDAALRAERDDVCAQYKAQKARLMDAEQRLAATYSSTSWRITAPLRALMTRIRNVIRM